MSRDDGSCKETAGDHLSKEPEKPRKPSFKPKTTLDKVERAERAAAEMRNNLLKRKQQQRGKGN
ncbi:MAG: hypothetical protein ACRBM6_01625 [Geminicoccales bacterium]